MNKFLQKTLPSIALCLLAGEPVLAHDGEAHYLANEGVMVVHGEHKILFDPLFHEHFGQYQELPETMAEALMAGEAPYDEVDAVFVSHHHGDHFSPDAVLELLQAQPQLHLYAPQQATAALLELDNDSMTSISDRVHGVELQVQQSPEKLRFGGITIEAVRIPHSGWPTRFTDVQNIVWRVRLEEGPVVVHMGDADPNDAHFARDNDFWASTLVHIAFPPYWFFNSTQGPAILSERIRPTHSVGVHVPVAMPKLESARPAKFHGVDLFTQPGEIRVIELSGDHAAENKH